TAAAPSAALIVPSTSGDRRHDRQLVAVFDRRLEVVEKADVVTVQIDVDEAPHAAAFVADAFLDAAELALEVVDHGADGGAGGAHFLGAAGEAAQGRWNANVHWHVGPPEISGADQWRAAIRWVGGVSSA